MGPSFSGLLVVAALAFAVPFTLGLVPALRIPAVVVEILAGIVIGPSVLGWVDTDPAIDTFALVGVAFLLLLSGLEIDYARLRGRLLRATALSFAASFGVAIVAGLVLHRAGVARSPVLLAIILSATALSVVVPVLKDSGQISTAFGQTLIAAASIADVGTVVLLSLFFSGESSGVGSKLVLLLAFAGFVLAVGLVVLGAERSLRFSAVLLRLQDTTAQIRVRAALVLLLGFAVAAQQFGLESILGAFLAGAVLKLVDRDQAMTHQNFRLKLEAAGFGIFVPFFFIASGIRFDGHALFASRSTLEHVPIFVAAIFAVRFLPALLYLPLIGRRLTIAAGLLQATTLSFVVVASQIGVELDLLTPANAAALVAAALVTVIAFPVVALGFLKTRPQEERFLAGAAVTPRPSPRL
jgi:Kef-type K+ transport system membrane component KefB